MQSALPESSATSTSTLTSASKPESSTSPDPNFQSEPLTILEPLPRFYRSNADLTIPSRASLAVHADLPSNTMAIYGHGQDKDLTELVPGILNQLGPDSLASLRKLAESYQNLTARQAAEKKESGEGEDEGDDVPDLVENFEEVDEADAKKDEAKLEELA